jgi:hypothetical protein
VLVRNAAQIFRDRLPKNELIACHAPSSSSAALRRR